MYPTYIQKLARTRLDDILLDEGILPRDKIEFATAEHERTGKQLSRVLFESNILDEWDLAKIVAKHYSLPFIDVTDYTLTADVVREIPVEMCDEHALLPLDVFGDAIAMAVCEMPSQELLRKISDACQKTPFFYVAVRHQIDDGLDEILKRGDRQSAASSSGAAPSPRSPKRAQAKKTIKANIPGMSQLPWISMDLAASVQIGGGGGRSQPTLRHTVALERSVAEHPLLGPEDLPARPKLGNRRPPVVPHGASASGGAQSSRTGSVSGRSGPSASGTAKTKEPSPGASQAGLDTSWETIFDAGDTAVNLDD